MTIMEKVLYVLRSRQFTVRFIGRHDWDGAYDWFWRVSISIYAPLPVSVLVHEVLHHLYPKKPEWWILEMETKVYERLTPKDRKYLSGVVGRARAHYEKEHGK